MSPKLFIYSHIFIFVYLFISIFNGELTFGHGLADIVYLIIFFIIVFFLILSYFLVKGNQERYLINIFLLIVFVIMILSLTIWRGIEYPWDGKLFYRGNF